MYDLVIVGAGPAALSAAVYAARYEMNVIVIGKELGGYAINAHHVQNYLGFELIEGSELAQKFVEHVKSLGVKIIPKDVETIQKTEKGFKILAGEEFECKKIIIATGTERNKLGVKGEKEFFGRGVSYCATCDGFFFKDRVVAVIGGGDSAATGALSLADIASKVYLIHRREEFKSMPAWQKKIKENEKIEVLTNCEVKEIAGTNIVEKIVLKDDKEIAVNGVFIEIGSTPASTFIKGLGIKQDENDYIIVDNHQKTNVDGVFAAGDITTGSAKLRQMITAAAEGAVAVNSAYMELKEGK